MDLNLYNRYLEEVRKIARANEKIAAHATIEAAFHGALEAKPKLIVELGTGTKGLRTQAICRAAALLGATMISVDLQDCRFCGNAWYKNWHFVHQNAISFAGDFPGVCKKIGVEPEIDLLFIDTDEKYDTTLALIRFWFGYLAEEATVMFRCTNLQKVLYYEDGKQTYLGWDNHRGVIRVLEDALGIKFDETKPFKGNIKEWEINHVPWGAGLTILRRKNGRGKD